VSRFVRLSNLIRTAASAETALKGVSLAFHLLNAMDKPEGCCNADFMGHKLSDHTRWAVVMDLTNPKMYFRTYEDLEIDVIDLKQLSFEKGTEHKTISLANKVQTFKDVTKLL
jgi:penicillin V acylase-like amidase (Ntn superfamily)